MNFDGVIFDFDGLLIDSEPLWTKADFELLGKRGFVPTEELLVRRLGTGNKRTIEIYKEEFGINESTEDLMEERVEAYLKLLDKNLSLMDGAKRLLEVLSNANKKLAIATSGPYARNINSLLKRLNIESFFSAITTGEEIENPKPHPDLFLLAAKRLGIDPLRCIVVEDAPSGIEAAKNAKMKAYGVNSNEYARNQLAKAGADEVYSSLTQISL